MKQLTTGYHIVGDGAVNLDGGLVISFPDHLTVQTFDTEEAMLAAHKQQFPDQYEEETPETIVVTGSYGPAVSGGGIP